MSQYVEFVRGWHADKDSVSQRELMDNKKSSEKIADHIAMIVNASVEASSQANHVELWIKNYDELMKKEES